MSTVQFQAILRSAVGLLVLACAATAATLVHLDARQDVASFRETVDVIEFDVRVVTNKGQPILGLTPDKFDVTLNGSKRRVVSASVIKYGRDAAGRSAEVEAASSALPSLQRSPLPTGFAGRIFVLVVDASTFDAMAMAGVGKAARAFVSQLRPDDYVGLFVFPTGSQINPTTDRLRVMNAVERIPGTPTVKPGTTFDLRPGEVVSLAPIVNDRTDRDSARIVQALCGTEPECATRLRNEVAGLIEDYELHALQSLNLLNQLIANLANIQGRKTLVVLSGGIPTSSRPGGRPDVGNLDLQIGQAAIRTNTSIYTLFVDWRYTQQFTATQRQSRRVVTTLLEDSDALSRTLEVFTGASGGALFKTLSGNGEVAIKRILDETSAYYVLGVEPASSDRDGKPRQLSVKVHESGATVRGSRWVTVPQRQGP